MDSDSTFEQVVQTGEREVKRLRWALGLNGALSVLFGVVVIVWPDISLFALTVVFGAYALATGAVGLVAAFGGALQGERGWLIVSSLLGIVTGLVVLIWPDISELALLYVIGAYAIALGVMALAAAFSLPLDGEDTAVMVISGVAGILFGVLMFAKPGDGALVVLSLIAAFALVNGVTELVVAIGGKQLLERTLRRTFAATPRPSAS
jgi:uncharacterized membrane protein HdeD (DUF308 family)